MRYLFGIIFLTLCTNCFAGIRQQWESLSDSILDKGRATVSYENEEYLSIVISDTYEVQMKLLKADDGTTVVCMVRTYAAPEKESIVEIYDAGWKKLRQITFTLADVIGDGDAASMAEYFEPLLISANLLPDADTLVLSVSDKNLSDDDKKMLNNVELQRNVNWGDGKFK